MAFAGQTPVGTSPTLVFSNADRDTRLRLWVANTSQSWYLGDSSVTTSSGAGLGAAGNRVETEVRLGRGEELYAVASNPGQILNWTVIG
jgi:hypothetical protein